MMPGFGRVDPSNSISLYACQQAPMGGLTSWVPVQAAIDAMGDQDQWNCKECSPARCGASPASLFRDEYLFHIPPLSRSYIAQMSAFCLPCPSACKDPQRF